MGVFLPEKENHGKKQIRLSHIAIRDKNKGSFGYISALKFHCDWLSHESTMPVAVKKKEGHSESAGLAEPVCQRVNHWVGDSFRWFP